MDTRSTAVTRARVVTRAAAFVLAWAAMTGPAVAAPFCVQTKLVPPQCIYYDARDCQRRASQLVGVCTANPAQVTLQRGLGSFCVTNGSLLPARCDYVDLDSCLRDATRSKGACLPGPSSLATTNQPQGGQSSLSEAPPDVPGSGFGFGTSFGGTHP